MENCSLTIAELENLNEEDLRKVGSELCLKACRNVEKKNECAMQVFQLCTQKLLDTFGSQNEFLKDAVELLKELLQNLLPKELHENSDNSSLELLESWVSTCAEFLSKRADTFSNNNKRTLLDLTLNTSLQIINFCCKFWNVVNLRPLLSAAVNLTHLSIDLLNQLIDQQFNLDDEEEAADFTKLNNTLCAMCSYCYPVELKTVMAIWKCLTRMVTMSAQFSIHQQFAARPIKTFLAKIGYWLNLISTKKLETPHQINSNLQIAKFLLKLLKCIFIDFRDKDLPEMEYFFTIYLLWENFTKALVDIPVNPLAVACVEEGFRDLMECLYKHEKFKQLLLAKDVPLNILQDYLSACANDADVKFLQDETKLQTHLFVCAFGTADIIIDECKYSELLEYFAFIAIVNPEFCLFLRQKVAFEKNLLLLHASAETLLLRANAIDSEQLLSEFRGWRTDNDCFIVCSMQVNGLYVQHLFQHYAKLCAKITKNDDLTLDFSQNMPMKVYRYYISILPVCPNKALGQDELLQETYNFLENQLVCNTLSVKQYYKLSLNLQLLTHLLCTKANVLVDSIQLLLVELLQHKRRLHVFETAAFNYLKKHVQLAVKSRYIENVLTALQNLKGMPSVAMLSFLCKCSKEAEMKLRKLCEQVLKSFSHIPWCELIIKPIGSNDVDYEQNKQAMQSLMPAITVPILSHTCESTEAHFVQASKRARFENISDSADLTTESLLAELLQKSNQLVNLNGAAFDFQQRQMIKNIISNLNQLL